MTVPDGMMTLDELETGVESGRIDTVIVAFTDPYRRLQGKRLDSSYFLGEVVANGSHACDHLLTVDMEMEPISGYAYNRRAVLYHL